MQRRSGGKTDWFKNLGSGGLGVGRGKQVEVWFRHFSLRHLMEPPGPQLPHLQNGGNSEMRQETVLCAWRREWTRETFSVRRRGSPPAWVAAARRGRPLDAFPVVAVVLMGL